MSDSELLDRIAKGDADAFAAFYDRHAARVLGLLIRMLRARADAEDVLQQVFWQVWNAANRYSAARGTPEVWLFLIARSRAVDLIRSSRRHLEHRSTVDTTFCPEPSARLEQEDSARILLTALQRLCVEQRTAIALAFYDGLTHEEVASRLSIPLGTAKTRIRSGLRQLRELLQTVQKEHEE